ncbi:MAG: YXWGXW repeat-containing protein [Candidatus Udaeobacter sp.]
MNLKPFVLRLALVFAALTACGCEGYYSAYPGYGPYYGGAPYYGSPGSVTIAVGDRPYYARGPGYWYGGAYYVWRPGHWVWRHGQQVWIHGHYVVRGY